MLEGSIEQCLDVYLTFFSCGVMENLDTSARSEFAVEGAALDFCAVIEIEFFRNLLNGSIQKHIAFVKYDYRVNDIFKVAYLMGRYEDDRILAGV